MSEIQIVKEAEIDQSTIEAEMAGVAEIIQFSNVSKAFSLPKSNVSIASTKVITNNGCVIPPYNPKTVLDYRSVDSTYQTCLDIRADSIVGLGYSFGNKDVNTKHAIVKFLKSPNNIFNNTFLSIMRNVFVDMDLFSNGYLEYVKSGKSRSIYYLPAKDMYIKPKKDKNGNFIRDIAEYCLISYDKVIASYLPYPADGKTKDGVHYCIHFKGQSQEDIFYGKPENKHLFDLIRQSYLSDQYNINFFSNGGQPAWACLITGGKLSKKAHEKIKDFIDNNLKGVANAHKMLFLSVPNEKAQIKLIPLSKAIDEQFISLSEKTQFRIALKLRVHPKLLGLSTGGNFGGGSAGITDLKLFMETVSNPVQVSMVEPINKFLEFEFGIDPEFRFNSMNISNEKDDAVIANLYWNMVDEFGNRPLTINEIRQRYLRMKPIDMKETPLDESKENDKTAIKPTSEGEIRSNNKTSLDIGDGEQPNNLDPNKNEH